jgi:hypothetical protein
VAAGALSLFLLASCDLGSPTKGGGTEGEGIVGALVDPSGAPLANVWVKAYALQDAGQVAVLGKSTAATVAVVESVLTNAQGTYFFQNLPVGSYNLTASLTAHGSVYAVLIQGVVVSSSLTSLERDTAKISGSFTLQVMSNGQPVVGASCGLAATPWVGVTDSSGTCTVIGLPPGILQVIVTHPALAAALSQAITVISGGQTEGGVVTDGEVAAPMAPLLLYPGDVPVVPDSGVLQWTRPAHALTFHIQLGTDSSFNALIINDSNVTSTSRSYGPLPGNAYFWRVRAKGLGGTSPWSPRGFFLIPSGEENQTNPPIDSTLPVIITERSQLLAPNPGDSITTASMTLRWSKITGATGYEVQVYSDSVFSPGAIYRHDTLVFDTARTIPTPTVPAHYFWRVRARNGSSGTAGPWSYLYNFRTGEAPVSPGIVPNLVSPAQGALVSTTPVLTWQKLNGTISRVEVALDTMFTIRVATDTLINTLTTEAIPLSKTIGPLNTNTLYYWRVRSETATAISMWSPIRSFMTQN